VIEADRVPPLLERTIATHVGGMAEMRCCAAITKYTCTARSYVLYAVLQ